MGWERVSHPLAHGDLAGGEQGLEQHGHGLGAGQPGLDLDAPAEFLVQARSWAQVNR